MMICEALLCTGCGTCQNICIKNAIQMEPDIRGFSHPVIDDSKCVKCGRCQERCPVNNKPDGHIHQHVYAALVKNDTERAKSTSGGVFACLAQNVLQSGGSVFGAVMDSDMIVRHWEAVDEIGLDRIRNSKYVQSEIGFCFQTVKQRLDRNEKVLFSGTPCQIAGLRNFLNNDSPNLLTVDILCHGVPSPEMFRRYVKAEEQRAGAKMTEMQFRSKIIGWKKILSVRTFVHDIKADWPDTFVPGFLKNLYLRESCYQCQYANDRRQGDITLGDFWGYRESAPEHIEDDDHGISLVIVNTNKGSSALRAVRKKLAFARRTLDEAKEGNQILKYPSQKPDEYDDFWKDAEIMEWEALCQKYIPEQDTEEWMSKGDRKYYSTPYMQRHVRHLIHCTKNRICTLLRKIV